MTIPAVDTNTAAASSAFLRALFAGKPDDLYLLLWTLPEKESRWFQDVEAAIRRTDLYRAHDLYVGIGLSPRNFGTTRRCQSEEIAGIVGICADLDLRSEAHPKSTLPETADQALSILPPELPPTFVILTGNGLQVWWLFREPYVFDTDDERRSAITLVSRFHTLLKDNASQFGWTYERLADLPRVLRVPGTTNCKDPAHPKPVTILSQTDRRYNPSELEQYLDDLAVPDLEAEASAANEWAERFKDTPLTITIAASVPQERIDRWISEDLRFKNTWFRQRADLPDQSQSGYDMALACFGFRAGCTEQQIVDLIIHHRLLHKRQQCTRLAYFQRTLSKAASGRDKYGITKQIDPSLRTIGSSEGAADPPSEERLDLNSKSSKAAICRKISAAFEVEVLRIMKIGGSDPIYRMELADRKIEFPNVAKLLSQAAIRMAIAGQIGKLIPRFKPKLWEEIGQLLLDACIDEPGSEELEYEGAARLRIAQYLADTAFISAIEGQPPQSIRRPMIRAGRILVCASDLQVYLNKMTGEKVAVKAVVAMLSAIGAKSERVRGNFREQSRWELPREEFTPSDYSTDGSAVDEN